MQTYASRFATGQQQYVTRRGEELLHAQAKAEGTEDRPRDLDELGTDGVETLDHLLPAYRAQMLMPVAPAACGVRNSDRQWYEQGYGGFRGQRKRLV